MSATTADQKLRRRAERCLQCPVCRRARSKQRGLAFWLVRSVESGMCPYCRACKKVYGRKAHEPVPGATQG